MQRQNPDPVRRASEYLRNLRYNLHPEAATRIQVPKALPDHIIMVKAIFNAIHDKIPGYINYRPDNYSVCGIPIQVAIDQGDASMLGAQALVDGKTVQVWL